MTAVSVSARVARANRTASIDVNESTTDDTLSLLSGVTAWWASRAGAAGLSGRWLDVSWAVSSDLPTDISEYVQRTDLDGLGASQIGDLYTATLMSSERARHGRHYTPTVLADELWAMAKRALGWKRPQALTGLVRDRACGAGALLLPVLREHLSAAARVDAQLALAALPNVIVGIDNDPHAVWLANVLLASEMLPVLARTERARRRPLPALVSVGDGLAPSIGEALVEIMNPPYGRVRLDESERARFAPWLYGHANLYGMFMAAGAESLVDGGVLASLTPTSFLAGRYFENLRSELSKVSPLREIEFVVNRSQSFEGVLQETCLSAFSRKQVRRTNIGSMNGHLTEVARIATPKTSLPWLMPRRSDDAAVAAAAITMPMTLASAGWRVSTGPLVWNRRRGDFSPVKTVRALPVIWGADIDGGSVHRDASRDGLRYLSMRAGDERTMVLDEPALLVQRTTAPEQTRRLVVAVLTEEILAEWGGQVIVENHVNVVRPLLTSIPIADLARLFATPTLDRVLRCLSGSVAVSAYELEALPLPSPDMVARWTGLNDDDYARAVAAAYRPVAR